MKRFVIVTVLCIAALAAALEASAQDTRLSSSSREFRAFYSKFIAAVHRGDKPAVASMTSFPLIYGFDAGDEGKYTRKQFFSKGFKEMFGKAPRTFLKEKNPVVSGGGTSYTVSTSDATHLIFTKGGRRFFFSDFLVEP